MEARVKDYLNYVCGIAESMVKNKNTNAKIIDGIAEVNINGIDYQAQIWLEPNKKHWVRDDKPTIRIIKD